MTTLLFSDKNVDSNLITWNRVVLLHGEVGGFSCDKVNGLELACHYNDSYLVLLQCYSSFFSEVIRIVLGYSMYVKLIQLTKV